jgi:hypothetical protein
MTPLAGALASIWKAAEGDAFADLRGSIALLFGHFRHLGTSWERATANPGIEDARRRLAADANADLADLKL